MTTPGRSRSCWRCSRRPPARRAGPRSRGPTAWCAARACSRSVAARACCPRCGLPRHRRAGCPAAGAAFATAWAPLAYEGVARDLVQALKFRCALPLAGLMAAQHGGRAAAGAARGDAVVPVPPHPRAAAGRGFDPAGALAAAVAARLGLPLAACLLARRRAPPGRRPRAPSGATRHGSTSGCARGRPRACCSSTTSTPRARRSTPAPGRWRPAAPVDRGARATRGRCDAGGASPRSRGRRRRPTRAPRGTRSRARRRGRRAGNSPRSYAITAVRSSPLGPSRRSSAAWISSVNGSESSTSAIGRPAARRRRRRGRS